MAGFRKSKTLQEQRASDFERARGAVKKGEKLSDRDKSLIALGRTQVHLRNQDVATYNRADSRQKDDLKKLRKLAAEAKKNGNEQSLKELNNHQKRLKKSIWGNL
ncbi:MAG: hypothetical protein FWC80_00900 [Firmicutes bacterium]|nr:hypothetical protein [Bacillota bacterium]